MFVLCVCVCVLFVCLFVCFCREFLWFGRFGVFSVFVKPNGMRNLVVTSLRLTHIKDFKRKSCKSLSYVSQLRSQEICMYQELGQKPSPGKGVYVWPEYPYNSILTSAAGSSIKRKLPLCQHSTARTEEEKRERKTPCTLFMSSQFICMPC